MACTPIITGSEFLLRTLSHIDCQAQLVGSYGYQALGQPGSPASTMTLSLLTVFIAFIGIRLMFGPPLGSRDIVFDVLKIGIALTLAFSWPAFRTVVYDLTLKGPAEIASVIQSGSGYASTLGFAERLQQTDNAIAELTRLGAGRNSGALIESTAPGGSFQSAAIEDDQAYGMARLLYLSGVIGSLALLRIGAGLLLALAPVVAGLYFFTQSRGIFAGWLKGLIFTFAGSIGTTIVLSVELAVLQPWLTDALRVRGLGYATPSAPTELFAMTLAFAVTLLMMLWLLAKVVFYRGWLTLPEFPRREDPERWPTPAALAAGTAAQVQLLRTERLSNTIESSTRRDTVRTSERLVHGPSATRSRSGTTSAPVSSDTPRLGSSNPRTTPRVSRSFERRDRT
ncbi:MAG: type IV secretion system protein [Pseudomonadota bacterium]